MKTHTLEKLLENDAGRRAVQAVQYRMDLTDAVMHFAFWHLDHKHAGKLPGVLRPVFDATKMGRVRTQRRVEDDLTWTDPEHYVEMVVELAQMDLLIGQANRLQAAERALASATRKRIVRKAGVTAVRVSGASKSDRQEIASRWRVVTSRRATLAEDSANWGDDKIVAMQASIRHALRHWHSAVNALKQ